MAQPESGVTLAGRGSYYNSSVSMKSSLGKVNASNGSLHGRTDWANKWVAVMVGWLWSAPGGVCCVVLRNPLGWLFVGVSLHPDLDVYSHA